MPIRRCRAGGARARSSSAEPPSRIVVIARRPGNRVEEVCDAMLGKQADRNRPESTGIIIAMTERRPKAAGGIVRASGEVVGTPHATTVANPVPARSGRAVGPASAPGPCRDRLTLRFKLGQLGSAQRNPGRERLHAMSGYAFGRPDLQSETALGTLPRSIDRGEMRVRMTFDPDGCAWKRQATGREPNDPTGVDSASSLAGSQTSPRWSSAFGVEPPGLVRPPMPVRTTCLGGPGGSTPVSCASTDLCVDGVRPMSAR